ncbi:EAL domain-containing protein [Klebsiella pneumoniae]|uniref:EAL domain-containing protein n=1 Tax=Klebsiella pneumoniae TaxID=573 RepID=UPI0021663CA8|nr:EAL domain-containing protein [Klebsiella pneumoniae]
MRKYLNVYTSEEEKLRYAITQGYIVPYYQPLVNGKTGEIYGVEILARWQNSTTPARSPAEFIPLAERTGLIIPLTRSLMAQVNAQMRPLFSKLPDGFHIGLNISVSHINAPTFIDDCLHYQRGFEGKAVKLMLEITEQEPLLLNGRLWTSSIRYTPAGFPSRWTTLAPAIPSFPVATSWFSTISKSIRVLSAG